MNYMLWMVMQTLQYQHMEAIMLTVSLKFAVAYILTRGWTTSEELHRISSKMCGY
jgi:uncharacterized membrane protein